MTSCSYIFHLPIGSNFVVAKYIQVPVTASDLEVAIVDAVPLIDVLGDVDLAAIEANSAELFDAILIHIGLCLDLHCVLLNLIAARPRQCKPPCSVDQIILRPSGEAREFCAHPRTSCKRRRQRFEVSRLQYHFSIRIRRRGFDPNQQKKGVA